jgi:hypothetical protein
VIQLLCRSKLTILETRDNGKKLLSCINRLENIKKPSKSMEKEEYWIQLWMSVKTLTKQKIRQILSFAQSTSDKQAITLLPSNPT